MMLRFVSFLTGRRIVVLMDMDGDVYYTLEQKVHPFTGKKCAYVYWFVKIRLVQLNDDGTVGNGSYIEKWKYV